MGKPPEDSLPEGKVVKANGLEIFYRELGTGIPLILLHGATNTHEIWKPLLSGFSEKFRVIAPDNRGHGRTINPEPTLTYQMMAEDLAGLIKALDLDSPYIFGYSDGGQAALDLALRYPGLAGVLVLGGIWHRQTKSYQEAITRIGFVGPGVVDYRIVMNHVPPDWIEGQREVHQDPRPDYPQILLEQLSRLWWTPLGYEEDDFRKISCPVMIIMGEKDEFIPLQEGVELADKIPNAEFVVIPGAEHSDVIMSGGIILDLILDFFERQAP